MHRAGFTLIELSIVLVIIGLVVGGVLVGQDLIKAAEIRGTISQLEKYTTATQTFKLKYNALPGDMQPATAATLGLFQITGTCPSPCNFGNGIIRYTAGGGVGTTLHETYVFWTHLQQAGLIEGTYGTDATNPLVSTTGYATSFETGWERLFVPEPKFKGYYISVAQAMRMDTAGNSYNPAWTDYVIADEAVEGGGYVTPAIAYAIDAKIDDGMPNTGTTVDTGGSDLGGWSAVATDATNQTCTYGGANNYAPDTRYNTNPATYGNEKSCQFKIRAGF